MSTDVSENAAFWSRFVARFKTDGHLIDPKFIRNRKRYAFQCSLVIICMLVVLLFLDTVYQTVLIAGLGSSSVAAFLSPNMRASRPRCLIGSYLVAVVVGCGLSMLVSGAAGGLTGMEHHAARVLVGAFATGLTMFLMAVTDTEHPTAAAIALGFVLNEWDQMTIVGVMSGIIGISVCKELVRGRLIDLL